MSIKLKPIGNHVAVKKKPVEEKSKGGIILTGGAEDKHSSCGEVVAVGPGKVEHGTQRVMQVKVGDTVWFGKYAGSEIGESILLMNEDDILAIEG
jgi:chaperonin GroES